MIAELILFVFLLVWFVTVTYGMFDIILRVNKIETDIQWLVDEHDKHNNYIHSLEVQLDELLEKEGI